jgi:hypothetical protein
MRYVLIVWNHDSVWFFTLDSVFSSSRLYHFFGHEVSDFLAIKIWKLTILGHEGSQMTWFRWKMYYN